MRKLNMPYEFCMRGHCRFFSLKNACNLAPSSELHMNKESFFWTCACYLWMDLYDIWSKCSMLCMCSNHVLDAFHFISIQLLYADVCVNFKTLFSKRRAEAGKFEFNRADSWKTVWKTNNYYTWLESLFCTLSMHTDILSM